MEYTRLALVRSLICRNIRPIAVAFEGMALPVCGALQSTAPEPSGVQTAIHQVSHGCIRVENPAELTAWALRNNPGWSVERVKQSMQGGSDNVTVTLQRKVPVFIVYATALAYDNDEVHFYDDIYGHGAKLAETLAKGYPSP